MPLLRLAPRSAARFVVLLLVAAVAVAALPHSAYAQPSPASEGEWRPLFDGKTLGHWSPSKFVNAGAVTVEDGAIVLAPGGDMTGVTWTGPELPKMGYELALEASRLAGSDFFAGITFPVGDSFCSLILGGWGGMVIGLSSVNGFDASENTTSQSREFENGRWYRVRIRVTPSAIEVWLDDEQIITQPIKGNKIHTREEMEVSKPFGIATWRTRGGVKEIRIRELR